MTDRKSIHIVNNSGEASYFEWTPVMDDENEKVHGAHSNSGYFEIVPVVMFTLYFQKS